MTKPPNLDEPAELRPAIIKSAGITESERYLARIAERSFLNLWSYPSPYRNQKPNNNGDGKEICDLLVVCGRHVIIFSEKTVAWPPGNERIAWRRWAKNAIRDAVKQIKGAERWISDFPDRIFIDKGCTIPFPITLPPNNERQIHRVVVANGAAESCQRYCKSPFGSLVINPAIKGDAHWPLDETKVFPFTVGDIDPTGPFVHVFNEAALDIVMHELDTITDFTDYLTKKEMFIRSGKLGIAEGEENLVSFYSIRINGEGLHDFVIDDDVDTPVHIDQADYLRFISNPQYTAKKKADEISYVWDSLIETFTDHMLDGTSIAPPGFTFDLKSAEVAVRYMALEPRYVRRSYGQAVAGALEKGKDHDRFSRVMMSAPGSHGDETAFFIQTLKYREFMDGHGGYSQYRLARSNHLQIYAEGLLEKYPHLKRVVGIAREPLNQEGLSEDLIYMEQVTWTDE